MHGGDTGRARAEQTWAHLVLGQDVDRLLRGVGLRREITCAVSGRAEQSAGAEPGEPGWQGTEKPARASRMGTGSRRAPSAPALLPPPPPRPRPCPTAPAPSPAPTNHFPTAEIPLARPSRDNANAPQRTRVERTSIRRVLGRSSNAPRGRRDRRRAQSRAQRPPSARPRGSAEAWAAARAVRAAHEQARDGRRRARDAEQAPARGRRR